MRHALFVAACVAVLLGVAGAHVWSVGADAMRASDALLAQGKPRQAAVLARRAAEAVVPGSPYPARGYARLEALAMAAKLEGKPDDDAFARRAMRAAAVATRTERP
jgi:hypothetical protein